MLMKEWRQLSDEEKQKFKVVEKAIKEFYQDFELHYYEDGNEDPFDQVEMIIKDKVFTKTCLFVGDFKCSLRFEDCYFLGKSFFFKTTFNKRVSFNRCRFEDEIRISDAAVFSEAFDLINVSVHRYIYVNGGKFEKCRWSLIDKSSVIINSGEFEDLNIGYWGGADFGEISFDLRTVSGSIKISGQNTLVQELHISQPGSASIAIEDINVNTITIYRYRNEKGLRLLNVKGIEGKKRSEFSIIESYLGKAEFYSIDFRKFDIFNLTDVHLVECSFVNISWKYDITSFKGHRITKTNDEELVEKLIERLNNELYENVSFTLSIKRHPLVLAYFAKNREVYRQIKYSLSKQGDVINEQKFHSKEMLSYDRAIVAEDEPLTKLIIKMSSLFSDFGQSLRRPLLGLLIGHWILLLILIVCGHFKGLSIDLGNPNMDGFKAAFIQYFKLINPLRRAENTFDGYEILIDLAMRVWSSYMIYNIIRATRRFIK